MALILNQKGASSKGFSIPDEKLAELIAYLGDILGITEDVNGSKSSTARNKKYNALNSRFDDIEWDIKNSGYNVCSYPYNAIGDGEIHPLSERYDTLEDAQEVYPFVTDLSQSIDWAAIQKAINDCPDWGVVYAPFRPYMADNIKLDNKVGIKFICEGTLQGISADVFILGGESTISPSRFDIRIRRITGTGNNQNGNDGFVHKGGHYGRIEVTDIMSCRYGYHIVPTTSTTSDTKFYFQSIRQCYQNIRHEPGPYFPLHSEGYRFDGGLVAESNEGYVKVDPMETFDPPETPFTEGMATFTNGSNIVTGTGFDALMFEYGSNITSVRVKLSVDSPDKYVKIASVDSDTQITLAAQYEGNSGTGAMTYTNSAPSSARYSVMHCAFDFNILRDCRDDCPNSYSFYDLYFGKADQALSGVGFETSWVKVANKGIKYALNYRMSIDPANYRVYFRFAENGTQTEIFKYSRNPADDYNFNFSNGYITNFAISQGASTALDGGISLAPEVSSGSRRRVPRFYNTQRGKWGALTPKWEGQGTPGTNFTGFNELNIAVYRVSGAAGPVNCSTMDNGLYDGQELYIIGTDDARPVTLLSTIPNLLLSSDKKVHRVFKNGTVGYYMWHAYLSKWVEVSFSGNDTYMVPTSGAAVDGGVRLSPGISSGSNSRVLEMYNTQRGKWGALTPLWEGQGLIGTNFTGFNELNIVVYRVSGNEGLPVLCSTMDDGIYDGQMLYIIGTSDTATVTLSKDISNLLLSSDKSANRVFRNGTGGLYVWHAFLSKWVEFSFSGNDLVLPRNGVALDGGLRVCPNDSNYRVPQFFNSELTSDYQWGAVSPMWSGSGTPGTVMTGFNDKNIVMYHVSGSGGGPRICSTMDDGVYPGQQLIIIGTSDIATVTLSAAIPNLLLPSGNRTDRVFKEGTIGEYTWSPILSKWIEKYFNG